MAEGLRGWLQEHTAGAGNWLKKKPAAQPVRANDVELPEAVAPASPAPAAPVSPQPVSAPGMSGRSQRRADQIELGPRSDAGDAALLAAGAATPMAATGQIGATIRNLTAKVKRGLQGITARGAGAAVGNAAGQAVNVGAAGVDAAKAAGQGMAEGYAQARPAAPAPGPQYPPNAGPQIPRGVKVARAIGGGLRGMVGGGGLLAMGAGAAEEAQNQMSQPGLVAAAAQQDEPVSFNLITNARRFVQEMANPSPRTMSRLDRTAGMARAGLKALNPLNWLPSEADIGDFLAGTKGIAAPGGQQVQSGSVPAPVAPAAGAPAPFAGPIEDMPLPAPGTGAFQRAGGEGRSYEHQTHVGAKGEGLRTQVGAPRVADQTFMGRADLTPAGQAEYEIARLNNEIQANRAIASPEAGGTGVPIGGLRGRATRPGRPFNQVGGPGGGGKFGDAFKALSELQGHGAAQRAAKNAADVGLRKATLANDVAKANLNANFKSQELQQKDRELDIKGGELGAKLRKENEERVNAQLDRAAGEITGGLRKGGMFGSDETADQYKVRKEQDAAKFRNSVEYSLRQSGVNVADMKNEQVQGFRDAHKIKTKMEAARGTFGQSVRDFFGNKRFDSDDLRSYTPVKAVKANDGGFLIHFANGNTAKVSELQDGKFNWTGPNAPVDADIAAILKPHIDKARQGKK